MYIHTYIHIYINISFALELVNKHHLRALPLLYIAMKALLRLC